ncbi:MAG TPA: VOC family protein [Jatrophihabitantaceae bacterium]|jgi:catechol 2,3-dioxygenase-like lactoylglutathione lyase family enzyme|nr:VOC family protein [Jatrophihabitantaceae bacterium]
MTRPACEEVAATAASMRLNHVGLTVGSLEASYDFYTRVVGLVPFGAGGRGTATARTASGIDVLETDSAELGKLTNNPGSALRCAFVQSPDARLVLQLVEYVVGGEKAIEPGHTRPGSPHISLYVDDVAGRFAAAAVTAPDAIASELVQITPTMRSFYLTDPDGVPVELIEKQVAS